MNLLCLFCLSVILNTRNILGFIECFVLASQICINKTCAFLYASGTAAQVPQLKHCQKVFFLSSNFALRECLSFKKQFSFGLIYVTLLQTKTKTNRFPNLNTLIKKSRSKKC